MFLFEKGQTLQKYIIELIIKDIGFNDSDHDLSDYQKNKKETTAYHSIRFLS